MSEQDFFSFDEALDQLNLKEEELKRLVSEGEIRAFREGDTMKLRRTDVETLRKELVGGEVVDLGGAGEELVFEDDLELEETGMATEEISDMDTLLEEGVEDVGEVALEEDDVEEIEPDEEEDLVVAPVASSGRRIGASTDDEVAEGLMMRALAIVTSAVLLLGVPIVTGISGGTPSALASGIAGMFGGGGGE